MAVELTPLGFKKPDGLDPVRNGDEIISDNAAKADELLLEARSQIANLIVAAGFSGDPLLLNDAAVSQAIAVGSTTGSALSSTILDKAGIQLWKPATAYTIGQRVIHPDGSVKVSKTNHTSGGTPGTLNWDDTPPLKTEQATRALAVERRRNAIRRESSGIPSVVTLPATFGWAAPIRIAKVGRKYATDFDAAAFKVTGGTTWHVNYTAGNDTTGTGASGAPYKTLQKAHQSAASGDTVIMHGSGVVFRDGSWQGTIIAKTLNLVAETSGALKYVYADNLTYTLTSGRTYVYQSSRTNVTNVVDLRFSRDGVGYVKKTTEADVEATPGSWMQDGSLVKVHQLGGGMPSSQSVIATLSGDHFHVAPSASDVAIYMEGFDIFGGNNGVLFDATAGYHLDTYLKNVGAYWASYTGTARNALNFFGTRYSYSQNVETAHGPKDGFNYTPFNVASTSVDIPHAIEVNCHAFDHGAGNPIAGIENTNNASTVHAGVLIVRIGGRYHDTVGAVVADVQTGTKSVNYSCISFDSRSTDTGYSQAWSAQQSGAEMWLFDCIGFGSTSDVYYVTGSTMHVDATEYDSAAGGGTLTITNAA